MDWGLLAGGVSQGLNNALQGANQGLIQGENIRAGRAQEALQGQHFGLQQQQLQAHLNQQQIQNQLAREQLGLHSQQLQNQMAYHQGMLGHYGAQTDIARQEAARKAALFPYEVEKEKAYANYMNARPEYMERWNDIRQQGADTRQQRADQLHEEALGRLGVLRGRLNVYAQRAATLSPAARLAFQAIQLKAKDLGQQLHSASYAAANGVPWKGPAVPELIGQMIALEEQAERLAQQQAGPQAGQQGTGPAQPPASAQSIRQKYGLQ